MNWSDLGEEIVKLGAPLLGAAISGNTPIEVLNAVLEAFSVMGNGKYVTIDTVHQKIIQDSNAAEKLCKIESDFKQYLPPPNLAG